MPGTYSQILLHVVFSTKRRKPWITAEITKRLYPYIGGIIRGEKGVLYGIGGIEDHVQLYLRWRPDASVSDLIRDVKAKSSKWMHENFPALKEFAWQEGYAVFSVSKSQEKAVKKYIAGQADHHKREDFNPSCCDCSSLTKSSSKNSMSSIEPDDEIDLPRQGQRNSPRAINSRSRNPGTCPALPLPLRGKMGLSNRGPRVCAACGFATAPLHPWLQSYAPAGAKCLWPRQGPRVVATGEARRNPW